MQATVPDASTRRLFLLALAAAAARADLGFDVREFITEIATALSAGNDADFISRFDRKMPDYDKLRRNVSALVALAELNSSVVFLQDEGTDTARTLLLEWQLRIKPRTASNDFVDRNETVTCKIEKRKKKWVVVSFTPLALFDVPQFS